MGVISLPAYVVGTATMGSPASRAMALASPVAEPPPMETSTPAVTSRAASRARATAATGTCCTTSGTRQARSLPS